MPIYHNVGIYKEIVGAYVFFTGKHTCRNKRKKRSRRDSNPRYLSVKRFSRPLHEESNSFDDSDLSEAQSSAYKPAYKENQKQGEIDTSQLPSDLAEILKAWNELPSDIKTAIVAIVRASR